MRFAWALILAVLVARVALAEPWDLQPPPRGEWVVDQTFKVTAPTRQALNTLATNLDASGAGQLGVLVIETTSGIKPRDFATGVFNSWGVGHHTTNDGILIFVAVKDRKAEIILGDGSKVTRSQTDAVMAEQIVANMKRGDLNAALLQAAERLDNMMRRAAGVAPKPHANDNTGLGPNAYTTPGIDTPMLDDALGPYADGSKPFVERSPRTWVIDLSEVLTASERARLDVAASEVYASNQGRIFYLVFRSTAPYPSLDELAKRLRRQVRPLSSLPAAIVVLDLNGPRAELNLPEGALTGKWEIEKHWQAEVAMRDRAAKSTLDGLLHGQAFAQHALTGTIPPRGMSDALSEGFQKNKTAAEFTGGGMFLGLLVWLRSWNRRRARSCDHCGRARQLLSDEAEDEHLSTAQNTEESVKSVDYDVWWCGRCNDALVLRYSAWFSGYSDCPECHAKTRTVNTHTLRYATEDNTGLVEVTHSCANCSYRNTFTRTTARISRSSSSDDSWSSSSSSSWSSSSSDSSFGGGSSSGGGSSGSW